MVCADFRASVNYHSAPSIASTPGADLTPPLRLCFAQIAVPSRTDVPEYQKLRSMVHEIVGRINGAFGTLTYVPIHHLDRQLSFTGAANSFEKIQFWSFGGFGGSVSSFRLVLRCLCRDCVHAGAGVLRRCAIAPHVASDRRVFVFLSLTRLRYCWLLPAELCALYAVTDVALVTSLRDGMNLVSYEYVACQVCTASARQHVYLLSAVAGACATSEVSRSA